RERGFNTTRPAPSARTNPSADASNARHRPVGESIEAAENPTYVSGSRTTFTPPASATGHSPATRLLHAKWTATSDDEHAASTARLGPFQSSTYETRFAATLNAPPVGACASIPRASRGLAWRWL